MRIHTRILTTLFVAAACATPAFAQESCNAHFTRSQTIGDLVGPAYTAMQAKSSGDYAKLLPAMEQALNAIPAAEIKAEACDGNHINAYTVQQYVALTTLKSRGIATGFPADLPIVKQPDLNQASLAYSVGWMKYELNNFDGALAAYAKGLAMFPNEPSLQQEYVATLAQLKRYGDLIAYADKVLADGTAMDDKARAKIYNARALAQYGQGDLKGAIDILGASLKYQNMPETQDLLKLVQNALAAKPN